MSSKFIAAILCSATLSAHAQQPFSGMLPEGFRGVWVGTIVNEQVTRQYPSLLGPGSWEPDTRRLDISLVAGGYIVRWDSLAASDPSAALGLRESVIALNDTRGLCRSVASQLPRGSIDPRGLYLRSRGAYLNVGEQANFTYDICCYLTPNPRAMNCYGFGANYLAGARWFDDRWNVVMSRQ